MTQYYGLIYKATNTVNGKSYIGQTSRTLERRKYEHEWSSFKEYRVDYDLPFHHAIRKYGKDSFTWEIIDYADSLEELNEKETYWIKYYETFLSFNKGYNADFGGNCTELSEETKEKLRKAQTGKYDGENNPFYGKKHTEETKKKISQNRDYKCGGENQNAKQVICLNDLKVYICVKEASETYGINSSHIGSNCRGKLKTAGKFLVFMYLKDYKNASEDEIQQKLKEAKEVEKKKKGKKINVIDWETDKIVATYSSMRKTAKELGISYGRVYNVLNGITLNIDNKYYFKYAE